MKLTKEVIEVYENALQEANEAYAAFREKGYNHIDYGLCYYISKQQPGWDKYRDDYSNEYVEEFYKWCRKEEIINPLAKMNGYWWDTKYAAIRIQTLIDYIEHLKLLHCDTVDDKVIKVFEDTLEEIEENYDERWGLCYYIRKNSPNFFTREQYYNTNRYIQMLKDWCLQRNFIDKQYHPYWWHREDKKIRMKVLKEFIKHLKEKGQ